MGLRIEAKLSPESERFIDSLKGFKNNFFHALVAMSDQAGTVLTEHLKTGIMGASLGLAANTPGWIAQKGNAIPLYESGQYVSALTWQRLMTTIAIIKVHVGFGEGMHSHSSHKKVMKLPGSSKRKEFSKAIPTWYLGLIHQRGSYSKSTRPAGKKVAERRTQSVGKVRDPFEAVVRIHGKKVLEMFLQVMPKVWGV